jgi:hypothetical protein
MNLPSCCARREDKFDRVYSYGQLPPDSRREQVFYMDSALIFGFAEDHAGEVVQ